MKAYKTRIGCMAVSLLLVAGCGDTQQKEIGVSGTGKVDDSFDEPLVIETTGDIIIDINDGNNSFDPFKMLNESDVFEAVQGILDNANWETAEVSMSRSADYRVEIVDKRDKEKKVTTSYYLWANLEHENIELVDYDNKRYVLMNKPDSEKLYKFFTDRNLSDHVVIE
ncbi:hypothetical protein CEW92_00005 [Bacillaceae bacterium SAS-127]|nr:hypothetical protein CEW92_00005 [Bacillaceae bacterium SAS-127]